MANQRGLLDDLTELLGFFDSPKATAPGVVDTEGEAIGTQDPSLTACIAAVNALALLVVAERGRVALDEGLTRKAWATICERAWCEAAKYQ